MKFDKVLLLTHIAWRNSPPNDPLEGPYTSVLKALALEGMDVAALGIPLHSYINPLLYVKGKDKRKYTIPRFLGRIQGIKYISDFLISIFFILRFSFKNRQKNKLFIGIDPLSCFPLILFKKIFRAKLIFYSVDFNKHRSGNKIIQYLYEKADEVCTLGADQVWVVCESLKSYKKMNFKKDSTYIPNSNVFNADLYKKGQELRTGNKLAWTGSLMTDRQFDIFFGLLKKIQTLIRNDIEIYLAPTWEKEKFEIYKGKYKLNKTKVLDLHSRLEWQKFVSGCDVGIAVYDDKFGSTKFIEPLKIWDFMMCGVPFIISREPSINMEVKESGAAFLLGKSNTIPRNPSLKVFLEKDNLNKMEPVCLKLAKKYAIDKIIRESLVKL